MAKIIHWKKCQIILTCSNTPPVSDALGRGGWCNDREDTIPHAARVCDF